MHKALLASTMLCAATGAHAQCTAPPQAAAAGFTTPVLVDNFTGGTIAASGIANWYPVDGLSQYSEGSGGLTIASDNSGFGAGLSTIAQNGNATNAAMSAPGAIAANTGNGVAYQYGYFQATMSFNPMGYTGGDWPAFWMGHSNTGPSNPNGNIDEIDVLEAMPGWPPTVGTAAENTATLHEWSPGYTATAPQHAFNPSQINFNQPNTYGVLWTPTSVSIYLNNVLQSSVAIGPGTPYPSASIDYNSLILGTGNNWPITVSNVGIWQSGALPASMQPGGADAVATAGCGSSATAAVSTTPNPAPTEPTSAPAEPTTPAAATTVPMPPATVSSEITPGNGSVQDCSGNLWTISSNNKILENGTPVLGGGDTSDLQIKACTVFGLSNGQNGSIAGWFSLSGSGWTQSAAPTSTAAAVTTTPVAPVAVQQCAASAPGTGGFHVVGGQIIGPDGQFIARGINIGPADMGNVQSNATALFKGLNFIRLATSYNAGGADQYQSFVSWATSQGIVVEIEDHPWPTPGSYSGAQLLQESAWYASMASAFKGNPYVWFGTMNEPSGDRGGIAAQEAATYQAIRSTGNNTIIMMEEPADGMPVGAPGGLPAATYAPMTNIVWDAHYYGWLSGRNGAADASTLQSEIQQSQTIPSADGDVPVITAEYGDSTDGTNVDPDAQQVVEAVINTASSGASSGAAAWEWSRNGAADNLRNADGSVSLPYGQMVQLYINTDVIPLSQCQLTAAAQTAINSAQVTVLSQQQTAQSQIAPVESTATTDPTVTAANAQAAALIQQADTLIQQAQTATAPTDAATTALIDRANANLAAAQAAMAGVGQ